MAAGCADAAESGRLVPAAIANLAVAGSISCVTYSVSLRSCFRLPAVHSLRTRSRPARFVKGVSASLGIFALHQPAHERSSEFAADQFRGHYRVLPHGQAWR